MAWKAIKWFAKSDYSKLLPILLLAFYMAFIPHQNYPYPVHIDEWVHLTYSEALLDAKSTTFIEPFYGQSTIGLSSNLEASFQLFWGVFHQISGISWLTIFRYFPGFIFMLTALSVYVFAKREGFGWEAALFACLIPTTVGILGPAFLVPVALGLLFIPLSMFLVFNFKTWWSYVVLFIFSSFLVAIHAPTAIGLGIILLPYILLNLKGNFKHSLVTTLAIVLPFLAPFPWIFKMLLPTAKLLFSQVPIAEYIEIPQIIQTYGYLPIGLCGLGTLLLAVRGGKKNYGLILGLLAMLVILVLYFTFHYGVELVYVRGLMYMMLALSIIAGAGLMGIRNVNLPNLFSWAGLSRITKIRLLGKFGSVPVSFLIRNIGVILCLALIGVTLSISIPARQQIPYYYMIDEADYQAFVWIRDNVNGNYDKAILDPWKATAFTAITQKHVYTRIHAYPMSSDMEAYDFLEGGCADTSFLTDRGISIVYSQWDCNNPDLLEVSKDVYLLKEAAP